MSEEEEIKSKNFVMAVLRLTLLCGVAAAAAYVLWRWVTPLVASIAAVTIGVLTILAISPWTEPLFDAAASAVTRTYKEISKALERQWTEELDKPPVCRREGCKKPPKTKTGYCSTDCIVHDVRSATERTPGKARA